MRRIGCALGLFALLLASTERPLRGEAGAVVDRSVVFRVVNAAPHLRIACSTDGATYRVVGHLVGPADRLSHGGGTVTVYVHGSGGGHPFHFHAAQDYDFVTALAQRGHVGLSLDLLGYGASDIPLGNVVCVDGEAHALHQVVRALHEGTYGGPAFERVVLVGHSLGGAYVEAEAGTYRDVAAIAIVEWAGQGYSPTLVAPPMVRYGMACASGGEAKRQGKPGGYTFLFEGQELRTKLLYKTKPEVADAFIAAYERDPCGLGPSFSEAFLHNHVLVPTIDVPVLLVYAEPGSGLAPGTDELEARQFVSSPSVTRAIVPDCDHFVMLCANHALFRDVVDRWLRAL